MSRSSSRVRRLPATQLPEQLAEVIQLHTPTVPDRPVQLPTAADQLAFPLLFVLDGGDE